MTGTDERLGTADRTVGTSIDGEHLAGELARLVAVADPVPPGWAHAARGAFASREIAGDQAQLDYDAEVVDGGGPLRRTRRLVRYALGARAVELDIDAGVEDVRLEGRLVPAGEVEVVAHWPGGQRSTTSDAGGGFRLDDLPRHPLCVQVLAPEPLRTGWLVP